jgi:hypothetical protein
MTNYPFEKKPAFFRVMSPELFFEAEAADESMDPGRDLGVADAELDALLNGNR